MAGDERPADDDRISKVGEAMTHAIDIAAMISAGFIAICACIFAIPPLGNLFKRWEARWK